MVFQKEAELLREEIELYLQQSESLPKGIYVVGQRGNGRKRLIKHAVEGMGIPLHYYCLFEESAYYRHQKHRRREIGKSPLATLIEEITAPAVLLLDGLELLSYKWKDFDQQEFLVEFLRVIKSVKKGVCIIATCVDVNVLPRQLQPSNDTTCIFSTAVQVPLPDHKQRQVFLELFLGKWYDWIPQCANQTIGYTIRDLYLICRETQFESQSMESNFPLIKIIKNFKPPLQLNGLDTRKPQISWEQVGGYKEIREQLVQLILWPIEKPELFERFQIPPPRGLLLYGPSGCGKTYLVNAFASNVPFHLFSVKCHQIYSKYLGESEQKIRMLFETCRKSRPCILFLDGIDALGTRREWNEDGTSGVQERVLSTLLNEMDGVSELSGVFVVACTSHPEKLDDALKRPGRLDVHLLVDKPSLEDRIDILNTFCKLKALHLTDKDINWIAKETEHFTCADLDQLIREAGVIALSESMEVQEITMHHVLESLKVGLDPVGWWKPHGRTHLQETDQPTLS